MKPQQTQDNEVERIREELDDIKETYANIVNQSCQDEREVHCSCVPALREEIARLQRILEWAADLVAETRPTTAKMIREEIYRPNHFKLSTAPEEPDNAQ